MIFDQSGTSNFSERELKLVPNKQGKICLRNTFGTTFLPQLFEWDCSLKKAAATFPAATFDKKPTHEVALEWDRAGTCCGRKTASCLSVGLQLEGT